MDSALQTKAKLRHNPDFICYWLGVLFSIGSYQMLGVVVGWQVYALTHSTFMLGMVGLVQFLPLLLATMPAGHVADNFDRRLVARTCQVIVAVAVFVLALANGGGWVNVTAVLVVVALVGVARAFERPASMALLPGIVTPGELPQALALSASATQTATIAGPALGGFLYLWGAAEAYATVAVCYALAAVFLTSIKVRRAAGARAPVSLRSMASGFKYIWNHEMVLGAISLDMFAVLLGGATALLPVFAHDILHVGPSGLGMLRAAPALGALLTALVLARYPLRRHAGLKMFGAVALFGLATVVFGLSQWFPLSLLALAVLGAADVVSVVVRGTLVQLNTPDEVRGRVTSVNFVFIGTSNQLGEFESGVTAALLGTVPAVVLGGVGTLLVAGLWMRMFPQLRKADRLEVA
ncbi:MAG: MFS transporter [Proteobacteria bacterium]|nr:MFS transporter [Pseudomonadota bacterium]